MTLPYQLPIQIAICGLPGTGTTTIAKLLSETTGHDMKSGGSIMRDAAQKRNMSISEFAEFCKTHPSIDRELDKTQQNMSATPNLILESRLAWLNLPDSFKILITCRHDVRITRLSVRENKTFEIEYEQDKVRVAADKERYYHLYNYVDYLAPEHFNLVVDSTDHSPEDIVRVILTAFEQNNNQVALSLATN